MYCVLVRVKAAVVEAAVGATKADSVRRTSRVRCVGVAEVDVVYAEVGIPEWGIRWHWVSCCAGAGETCVQGRGNDHDAEPDVVDVAAAVAVGAGEGEVDGVAGWVG